ncbi:MAG: PLDc_N domain-containing protein [Deltaproteobacteria bacterium]|nr:PLDc_N domain-containing protein [Deltaproteobacteria bacterium]
MDERTLLLLLAPLVLLDLGGKVWALVALSRAPRVRGPKIAWVLVILFVNLFGWVAFLLAGRDEG